MEFIYWKLGKFIGKNIVKIEPFKAEIKENGRSVGFIRKSDKNYTNKYIDLAEGDDVVNGVLYTVDWLDRKTDRWREISMFVLDEEKHLL